MNVSRSTLSRRRSAVLLGVLMALVNVSCGEADSSDAPANTVASPTTAQAQIQTEETTATTVAAAPGTTSSNPAGGDLPTEMRGGIYLVGTEIRPGTWTADECGCPWALVAADGTEVLGTGEDAHVPAEAHAVRLGGCTWTLQG